MKTIIVFAVIAVLGSGGVLLFNDARSSTTEGTVPDDMLYTVIRDKLTVTITENGSLNAKESEKITFEAQRSAKITFLIEEGKSVEKDEVLCRLETTDLETELQELELNILQTEADLDTAKTELEIQQSENVANIQKAKIALTKSKNELERYRDGDAPKERRNLEVAIKEAETNFSRSKKKYEDSVRLLEQDYINKSQVEQDEIEFERADIQLAGSKRDLEIFDQYTLPMTSTDKTTAVADAQRDLDNADKRAKSTLHQKEVAVTSSTSRLSQLTKKRDKLKEMIEKFTIKSPSPGIVIYGEPNRWWYRDEIKLGGQIWGGFTLFTIPDLRVMQVNIEIHEADINKLEVGQKATVTMDTYPGLVLDGSVTKIASIAGGGGRRGRDEVKKFSVEVTLDSTKGETLKPGISAKAEIFIDEREDVLTAPLQCVFFEEGKHHAFVMRDGSEPVRVEVKPDLSNDSHIQIVEGLAEGDKLLLYNPRLHEATGSLPGEKKIDPAATQPTAPVALAEPE